MLHADREARAKYEQFVDQRLRVDLAALLADRDSVYGRLSDLEELRKNILVIRNGHPAGTTMKTMINLGSDFFVRADVPDPSKLFLDIGLGFHVELTLDEALDVITTLETFHQRHAESLNKKVADLKSHLSMYLTFLSAPESPGAAASLR
eukprot:gnl/Hemi2/21237_TR7045_c0_g1_i1.p1 gnl/Hemi2/21237_TR7045_c0_g1~~gnl/Hemi2/21237_TR7045_c0_g1_i1.p1  ORF type:complete len:150 (-),score=25.79 gnl/Hemi2/21237_TR7045_c0_g1_i1:70-519(-)